MAIRKTPIASHPGTLEGDIHDSVKSVLSRQYEAAQLPGWKYVDVQINRSSLAFQLKSEFVVGGRDEVSKLHIGGGYLDLIEGNWRNIKSSAVESDKLGSLMRSGADVDDPRVQEQIKKLAASFDLDVIPASLQEMRDIAGLLERFKDRAVPNLR